MFLKSLSKRQLAQLTGSVKPNGSISQYLFYKIHFTDDVIIKMGFEVEYFRAKHTFGFDDVKKIQSFMQFDEEDLNKL